MEINGKDPQHLIYLDLMHVLRPVGRGSMARCIIVERPSFFIQDNINKKILVKVRMKAAGEEGWIKLFLFDRDSTLDE